MLQSKNVIIKKTDNGNQAQVVVHRVVDCFKGLLVAFVLMFSTQLQSQCLPAEMPFNIGEIVDYDIYFKWGFITPRAGQGQISFNRCSDAGEAKFKYQLTFQTSKFFDAIYKMRDTLECFYGSNYSLLYSSKRTSEGGYYSVDELTFSYSGDKTSIHSYRYTPEKTKIDTFLTVTSGCVTDMFGATFWLRTLDWDNMRIGQSYSPTIAIGRDLAKINFRYQGQSIVEHNEVKYRTHYFHIDIFDEVFEQSKSAAEVWIGDDENYITIKIRTKLKIGHAEVYYKSSANLKAPLRCRVEMKQP